MDIKIIPAEEKHVETIAGLIREFAEYEKLSHAAEVTAEDLRGAMFGPAAFVRGLIALNGRQPAGYALFYPCFATFRGQRGIWLEDIFVREEYRRHRLGKRLLGEVARAGKLTGARRIDFLVLDWNTPATNFYLKHGAVTEEGTKYFKFTDKAFERLASE